MLISALDQVKRGGGEHRTRRLYGQERNHMTAAIARMNLVLCERPTANVCRNSATHLRRQPGCAWEKNKWLFRIMWLTLTSFVVLRDLELVAPQASVPTIDTAHGCRYCQPHEVLLTQTSGNIRISQVRSKGFSGGTALDSHFDGGESRAFRGALASSAQRRPCVPLPNAFKSIPASSWGVYSTSNSSPFPHEYAQTKLCLEESRKWVTAR